MAIQVDTFKIEPFQPNLGIYHADDIRIRIKGYKPIGQSVPKGINFKGTYFEGYPQIVKNEGSQPLYKVKVEKDIMVPMRDGVRLATDVYRPDVEGRKFPALLSFYGWGKELQEMTRWLPTQEYYDSPLWDGCIETGNIDYAVIRGYIYVIPDPRNIGKSEGTSKIPSSMFVPVEDTYDLIQWIAKQPWCNGIVGMTGSCGYSGTQFELVEKGPPPELKAIAPFLNIYPWKGDYEFTGLLDCKLFSAFTGRHGNDSAPVPENTPTPPKSFGLPKEELKRRLEELLNHPDIKLNSKWYSLLKYPMRMPIVFDQYLDAFHPKPAPEYKFRDIKLPVYLTTSGIQHKHVWPTFETWERLGTLNKKLMLWPNLTPDRPQTQYADEVVRWMDYWLKGIDTGILDEPPIKMFVNGVNKWRFEEEWPLKNTEYIKLYLHPRGGLSTEPVKGMPEPDSFTQPAPYVDPTVYCLTYQTRPMTRDVEMTGYMALYLEASLDKDDTNWMVDLVDISPEGKKTLVTSGALSAEHRTLDAAKSKPYLPVHPREDPVPVPPGEVIEYAIALMPTSIVFKQGHTIELIIRNQDDLLGRLGGWGVHSLPHMTTVTHNIYFGKSHLLLPLIPSHQT